MTAEFPAFDLLFTYITSISIPKLAARSVIIVTLPNPSYEHHSLTSPSFPEGHDFNVASSAKTPFTIFLVHVPGSIMQVLYINSPLRCALNKVWIKGKGRGKKRKSNHDHIHMHPPKAYRKIIEIILKEGRLESGHGRPRSFMSEEMYRGVKPSQTNG